MKRLLLIALVRALPPACRNKSVEPVKLKWVTATVLVQVVTPLEEAQGFLVTPLGPFEGYCWSSDTAVTGCQGFAVTHFGQKVTGQTGGFQVLVWNQTDTLYSDYCGFADGATVYVLVEKQTRGN